MAALSRLSKGAQRVRSRSTSATFSARTPIQILSVVTPTLIDRCWLGWRINRGRMPGEKAPRPHLSLIASSGRSRPGGDLLGQQLPREQNRTPFARSCGRPGQPGAIVKSYGESDFSVPCTNERQAENVHPTQTLLYSNPKW